MFVFAFFQFEWPRVCCLHPLSIRAGCLIFHGTEGVNKNTGPIDYSALIFETRAFVCCRRSEPFAEAYHVQTRKQTCACFGTSSPGSHRKSHGIYCANKVQSGLCNLGCWLWSCCDFTCQRRLKSPCLRLFGLIQHNVMFSALWTKLATLKFGIQSSQYKSCSFLRRFEQTQGKMSKSRECEKGRVGVQFPR